MAALPLKKQIFALNTDVQSSFLTARLPSTPFSTYRKCVPDIQSQSFHISKNVSLSHSFYNLMAQKVLLHESTKKTMWPVLEGNPVFHTILRMEKNAAHREGQISGVSM